MNSRMTVAHRYGGLWFSTAWRTRQSATVQWTTRKPSCYRLSTASPSIELLERQYQSDEWTNIPDSIVRYLPRRLHLQRSHPLSLTRRLITSRFPPPSYKHYDNLCPIVSVRQNFDSLGFPRDHPGRSRTDTYYVNASTCLRTHTSAHQADVFRSNLSEGYTISADVYRRDAIDRSHYPIFHQMEGARLWDRQAVSPSHFAAKIWSDLEEIPRHTLNVNDAGVIASATNPIQASHKQDEVEAVSTHLKRSLEDVVFTIFKAAQGTARRKAAEEQLQVRWVETHFPFTSPSWELEVYWRGEWLELLGCGIVQQSILDDAGVSSKIGWAFGLGIERIAMLLYDIPDIRLFWSQDDRFLSQFVEGSPIKPFVPFSKYPPCWKDVSFWLPIHEVVEPAEVVADGGATGKELLVFHENDFMEIIRDVAGSLVEDVILVDEFQHPDTKQKSMCYRINYRSLERTLTNEEVNELHECVRCEIRDKIGVVLR